jgi:hypothetical protein
MTKSCFCILCKSIDENSGKLKDFHSITDDFLNDFNFLRTFYVILCVIMILIREGIRGLKYLLLLILYTVFV